MPKLFFKIPCRRECVERFEFLRERQQLIARYRGERRLEPRLERIMAVAREPPATG